MEINLPGAALETLFGRLDEKSHWHCLESGLSRLRGKAKAFGVDIESSRRLGIVTVRAKDAEGLDKFRRHLSAQAGAVQRGMARALEGRSSPGRLREFLQRQVELAGLPRGPFIRLPGIGALMGTVFVDPPFDLEPRADAASALETAASLAGLADKRFLIVVGPSAIGKSALLREAFKRAARSKPASVPVHLPARNVRFQKDGALDWRETLGVEPETAQTLDVLWGEGKLCVFLDGLDENLKLLEPQDGPASSFWAAALKNRLVMSCRDREYVKRFQFSGLEKLFNGGLSVMRLSAWTAREARFLYARLARKDPKLALLADMPCEALAQKLSGLTLGGFSAWAYALCAAASGRLPRNEYEALDYVVEQIILREGERGLAFEADVLKGILMRVARGDFSGPGKGKVGRVPAKELWSVIEGEYPELAGRKEELSRALRQLPFVSYDGIEVVFTLERSTAVAMAAKNFLRLARSGNDAGLISELRRPLDESIWLRVMEGASGLGEEDQRRILETGAAAFEACLRASRADPVSWAQQDFTDILTILRVIPLEEARRYVEGVFKRSDVPETARIACAAGWAHAGDREALCAYARHLDGRATARKTLRDYYLYWLGDAKTASWDKTARWLAKRLLSAPGMSLAPIYAYVFCDLARTLGPVELPNHQSGAEALRRQARRWPARFKDCADEFLKIIGE